MDTTAGTRGVAGKDPVFGPRGRGRCHHVLPPELEQLHHVARAVPVVRAARHGALQLVVPCREDRGATGTVSTLRASGAGEFHRSAVPCPGARRDRDHRDPGRTMAAMACRADGLGVLRDRPRPGDRDRALRAPVDQRPLQLSAGPRPGTRRGCGHRRCRPTEGGRPASPLARRRIGRTRGPMDLRSRLLERSAGPDLARHREPVAICPGVRPELRDLSRQHRRDLEGSGTPGIGHGRIRARAGAPTRLREGP